MNIKKLLTIIIILGLGLSLTGQNRIDLSGQVVDAKTKEELAFVNVGIVGTLMGTASNSFGEFSFSIPSEESKAKIIFSAIGYKKLEMPVKSYLDKSDRTIELMPLTYGIEDIEVSTASKVLYRKIKDAGNSIRSNYIQAPYTYSVLYTNEVFKNQSAEKKRNAIVQITDSPGYTSRNKAYQSLNYRFVNVQRNFEVNKLTDGLTEMDNLLSLDIVRAPGNILDIHNLDAYDLQLIRSDDSLQVIAYQLVSPDYQKTGDFHVRAYRGQIYISSKSNAIVKVEGQIQSAMHSIHGRSVATDSLHANLFGVNYSFVTTWKKYDQAYCLEQVACLKRGINQEGIEIKQVSSIKTIGVDLKNIESISKREYYENLISDPDFWIGLN